MFSFTYTLHERSSSEIHNRGTLTNKRESEDNDEMLLINDKLVSSCDVLIRAALNPLQKLTGCFCSIDSVCCVPAGHLCRFLDVW